MRDLDAAGTRLFGDLNYLVEILFGQVPLTDLCAGRRCAPRTVRVLVPHGTGHECPDDLELLDFGAAVPGREQPQCVDRQSSVGLETDNKQRRQRTAEIFQDLAFPLSEENGLIVKGDGIAGLLRGHGEQSDTQRRQVDVVRRGNGTNRGYNIGRR